MVENAYDTQPKLKQIGTKDGPVSWASAEWTTGPPIIVRSDIKPAGLRHCSSKAEAVVEVSAIIAHVSRGWSKEFYRLQENGATARAETFPVTDANVYSYSVSRAEK